MRKKPEHLESLAVRTLSIKDADIVRYRVYTSPTDFIAVIAENALMAMKLTGIHEPYRVVRDLPMEDGALEKNQLEQTSQAEIVLPTQQVMTHQEKPDPKAFTNQDVDGFEPLSLGALRRDKPLEGSVVAPHTMIRILSGEPDSQALEAPAHSEVKPLNLAQETLLEKAILPDAPLSPSDVVQLLNPSSD